MDLGMDVKEEPVWCEATEISSVENVELVPEITTVEQEIKSELPVPTKESESETSADIKQEVFIEEDTVAELVPYVKQEDKSGPEASHADPPPSLEPACFRCDLCGKVLSSKNAILLHIKGHTGDRPFMCDHCPKNFAHNSKLSIHMRMHTGEKPYQCAVCGKSFTKRSNLYAHNRKHTGVKPYVCLVCNKTFAQSGTLASHMRIHTGEKPYYCTICNLRFSQTGSLSNHLKSHRGKQSSKSYSRRYNLQGIFSKIMEEPALVKCEPAWSSDTGEPSNFEYSQLESEMIPLKQETKSELTEPGSTQQDAFE